MNGVNQNCKVFYEFIKDFQRGRINTCNFGNNFIWTIEDKLLLLDSIKKNYPIGSLVIWKPVKEINFNCKKDLLCIDTGQKSEYDAYNDYYLLDGFNRLSTIISCFIDIKSSQLNIDEEKFKKKYNIVYNVSTDQFYPKNGELDLFDVPLNAFVNSYVYLHYKNKLDGLDKKTYELYHGNLMRVGKAIMELRISYYEIYGGTVEEAQELFYRLNPHKLKTII